MKRQNEIKYTVFEKCGIYFKCTAEKDGMEICRCQMHTDSIHCNWVVSSWFTHEDFCNKGIGKQVLGILVSCLLDRYGMPERVEYIWNGANQYVMDWLVRNFDARCECPIAVQKTQPDDDWSSHQYELNVDKFVNYFASIYDMVRTDDIHMTMSSV